MELLLFLFLLVGYLAISGHNKAVSINNDNYVAHQVSKGKRWEGRVIDRHMSDEIEELIMKAAETWYGPLEYESNDPLPTELSRVYSEVSQAYQEMGWDMPNPYEYLMLLKQRASGERARAMDIMLANRGVLSEGTAYYGIDVKYNGATTAIRRRKRCIHDKKFAYWIVDKVKEFGIDDPVYFIPEYGSNKPIPIGSEPDESYGTYKWLPMIWDHEFKKS